MSAIPTTEAVSDTLAQAKPPFLRRVRIRGYKSIAFCDVTLEPLTILVGRNASGKSNFLDALGFLRDSIDSGIAEALRRRGGLRGIICRSMPTGSIEIELEAMLFAGRAAKKEYRFCYRVEIQVGEDNILDRPKEKLTITDVASGTEFGFRTEQDRAVLFGPGENNSGRPYNLSPDLFLRADVRDPDFDLAHALLYMGFYNFHPETMRLLRQPNPDWLLERDGSNIASAISSIRSHDPSAFIRVQRYFSAVAQPLELLGVVQYGSYETVQFRVQCPGPSHVVDFDAVSMSDGTLRIVGALVAAFQHVGRYGSPSLVAIEEPETALHPAAMRALVAALDEATLRTQVLLTTHSPDLLDAKEVKPANVRVVQMIDGQTVIGPVDEASVSMVRDQLSTLGGLERERQLEPDIEDLEAPSRVGPAGASLIMTLFVAPIVEGETEERSIKIILSRIWRDLLQAADREPLAVLEPVPTSRTALVKESHEEMGEKVERAFRVLRARIRQPGVDRGFVLVLIDAEEDCPARLAPQLLARARLARSDADIACVLAKRELENWFKAAAASLSGLQGLPNDLAVPANPEEGSGDTWLTRQMQRQDRRRKYTKPADAVELAQRMDLQQCRDNSSSFDKLCRELEARLPRPPAEDTGASEPVSPG